MRTRCMRCGDPVQDTKRCTYCTGYVDGYQAAKERAVVKHKPAPALYWGWKSYDGSCNWFSFHKEKYEITIGKYSGRVSIVPVEPGVDGFRRQLHEFHITVQNDNEQIEEATRIADEWIKTYEQRTD